MGRPIAPHFNAAPPAVDLAQTLEALELPAEVQEIDLSAVIPALPDWTPDDTGPYTIEDFSLADLPPVGVPASEDHADDEADLPDIEVGIPDDIPMVPADIFDDHFPDEADAADDHLPDFFG